MVQIRPMSAGDWPGVRTIYAEGIATGHATFETAPPEEWDEFEARRVPSPRLVAVSMDRVVGWAAASPVSGRSVYRGVIEHSLYVASAHRGAGIGKFLLDALIRSADEAGYWMIQSSIFPENTASLRLHAGAGFRVVGRRERIALMTRGPCAGAWRDTILIERRSTVNGATE
ncbi:N-acetyltransferase family protein [Rathayibacter sp. YIM 133350]|uniref:GNAT family N-acetyltransferase n=1 Tax=Rathayibacter sp. YIM 133350 TaxID=3131992 RepID=UPI00307DED32